MFPHDREVPEGIIQELTGILLHAGIGTSGSMLDVLQLTSGSDCMASANSTVIYSEPDVNKLLSYVSHLKFVGGEYGFSACVVGKQGSPHFTEYSSWFSQVA